MVHSYFTILAVWWRVFGPGKIFFSWLLGEPLAKFFTFATLWLDNLFFPEFKKCRVERPVFIIGHPRSGTTFLHKLLTQLDGVAAFKAWHIFVPALSARKLLRPLVEWMIQSGRDTVLPEEAGHRIALGETEEEEMLFMNNYDTQFMNVGFLDLDDRDHSGHFRHDCHSESRRIGSMRFLDGCFRRQLYFTGKNRVVAQTHFSTFRLKTMMEFYPDAKFICLVRSPLHVVPSFLSLLHKTLDHRMGLANVPPETLRRYTTKRYKAMIELYRYFSVMKRQETFPADRVLVMPYEDLIEDLSGAFRRITDFIGHPVEAAMRKRVEERSRNQKAYQRKHQVFPLEHFGLTREQILTDFAFVFEEYGVAEMKQRVPVPTSPPSVQQEEKEAFFEAPLTVC